MAQSTTPSSAGISAPSSSNTHGGASAPTQSSHCLGDPAGDVVDVEGNDNNEVLDLAAADTS